MPPSSSQLPLHTRLVHPPAEESDAHTEVFGSSIKVTDARHPDERALARHEQRAGEPVSLGLLATVPMPAAADPQRCTRFVAEQGVRQLVGERVGLTTRWLAWVVDDQP